MVEVKPTMGMSEKNSAILDIIFEYGGVEGAHHKQWVLDHIVKIITADEYDSWVSKFEAGEDGPKTYEWDAGIAP